MHDFCLLRFRLTVTDLARIDGGSLETAKTDAEFNCVPIAASYLSTDGEYRHWGAQNNSRGGGLASGPSTTSMSTQESATHSL